LPVTVRIGKAGLTVAVAAQIADLLSRRELVKLGLPAGPAARREALARQVAEAARSALAELKGRTVLLYRPNEAIDAPRRIALPEKGAP